MSKSISRMTDEELDARVKEYEDRLAKWKAEKKERTAKKKAEEERRRMQAAIEFASEWRPVVEWMQTVGKGGGPLAGDGERSLLQCVVDGYRRASRQADGTSAQ